MSNTHLKKTTLALAVSGIFAAGNIQAQETSQLEVEKSAARLPQMNIVGASAEDALVQPGAVTLITAEDIERSQPRSTEDVLRRVPGPGQPMKRPLKRVVVHRVTKPILE